jgi:hypothetical protein
MTLTIVAAGVAWAAAVPLIWSLRARVLTDLLPISPRRTGGDWWQIHAGERRRQPTCSFPIRGRGRASRTGGWS